MLDMRSSVNVFDAFAEYAFAIRSLCNDLNVGQDDLTVFPFFEALDPEGKKYIKTVRMIPIRIDIPEAMSPKQGEPYILIKPSRTPDDDNIGFKTPHGLVEYELTSFYNFGGTHRKIKFWGWHGSREYYPVDSLCFFVLRKDYGEFMRSAIRHQQTIHQIIQPPILPHAMLDEIYKNTIGFLRGIRTKQSEYQKYKISCKRGLLFCGPPGCVLGDTKIKVRKISDEGKHELYIV